MKIITLATVAIALLIGASAAVAKPLVLPPPGAAAAQTGPKDYSKNSATGDHRQQLRTSSLAGTTSPPARRTAGGDGDGIPWTAIALGLAGGSLVAAGAVALAGRSRRSRVAV
jgi:hypothetical protein